MAKKSPKVEITARITMLDGQVIEGIALGNGDIPLPEDFDNSTREGFLRDFDALESSIISARDKATSSLAENYLKEASKEIGNRRSKNNRSRCPDRKGMLYCQWKSCLKPQTQGADPEPVCEQRSHGSVLRYELPECCRYSKQRVQSG